MVKGYSIRRKYREIVCITLSLVILAAGAATTAFSYTWFTNKNNVTRNITGRTAGAYFARGTGKSTDPYVINKPIHLYNLAWLQDIGYFDDKECYFIIETDLDMTGWTLPPIGTEEHPFIGHLSGNDETYSKDQEHPAVISNLTISNDFNSFNKHPGPVTSFDNCNMMGFFGKFGEGNKNPSAQDFYLNSLKVESKEKSNLIGMLAGYVNGNLSGIGISNSTIKLPDSGLSSYGGYTTNISDYASVGYCEDEYKTAAFDKEITLQSSAVTQSEGSEGDGGSESGNGGSIDMNAMYNNLYSIWQNLGRIQIPTKETISYDKKGNIVKDEIKEYTNATDLAFEYETETSSWWGGTSTSSLPYYLANATQDYDSTHTASSYSFARRTDNTGKYYMTLYGRDSITDASVKNSITENRILTTTGKYIYSSNGGNVNYFTLKDGAISNATSESDASIWVVEEGGLIYTHIEDTTYYLRNNFGSLTVTNDANSASNWTNNGTSYVNGTGIIQYSKELGWYLESTGTIKIADKNKTYWLCQNGSNDSVTINNGATYESSAVEWGVANDHYYAEINGANYYLGSDSTITYSEISGLVDDETDAFTAAESSTGCVRFSITKSGTTYYMSYYNSRRSSYLDLLTNRSSAWEFTLSESENTSAFSDVTIGDSSKEIEYTSSTTSSVASTYKTNPTYYPISGTNGIPDEKNTGYVVSGCYNSNDTLGDIRVSKFEKGNSNGLYKSGIYSSNNTLSTVKTINDSGIVTVSADDFDHYSETKTKFETILAKDNSYISGLHFMDATISKEHLVELNYARIGNEEYIDQGYQLPEDSLDFHLRRKGYVNFFAGTYAMNLVGGASNDSFFSLHEIERDESGTKIKNIREIEEIYKPNSKKAAQSYVYKYSDGTYSVPFLHGSKSGVRYDLNGNPLTDRTPTTSFPSGYISTPVFKTSWIKKNTDIKNNAYYAFYFEIPCNEGEYALGSVPSGTGAYLDYLDIGANAQKTEVSTLRELKAVSTYVYYYPKGVSFSFIGGDSSNIVLPAINEKENAAFSLDASFGGDITVTRTDATDKSTISYETSSKSNDGVKTEYKYQQLDVTGNGTQIPKATGLLKEQTIEDTITKISYSLSYDKATTTTYKKVTDKDGNITYSTVVDGEETSGTDSWPTDGLDWDAEVENKACVYVFYIGEDKVTITLTSTYVDTYNSDNGTHYYALSGYKIALESTLELEVTLVELNDSTLTVKLKTGSGDTEDDYVTLELNVTKTIESSGT